MICFETYLSSVTHILSSVTHFSNQQPVRMGKKNAGGLYKMNGQLLTLNDGDETNYEYVITFRNFCCNNKADAMNVILGMVAFWAYGFRTLLTCGYNDRMTYSQFHCSNIAGSGYNLDSSAGALAIPFLPQSTFQSNTLGTRSAYYTCSGTMLNSNAKWGSMDIYGSMCGGSFGSGDLIVGILLMLVSTVAFVFKAVSLPWRRPFKVHATTHHSHFLFA